MYRLHVATAYHEAGHAVAGIRLGILTDTVTIEPNADRGSLGHSGESEQLFRAI